ncbi:MAG: prepilin peptidase [Thermodesulfobacteriota bacterium]|nr:prepilin peptidase [Thermodesulfobacteriota bacterium]
MSPDHLLHVSSITLASNVILILLVLTSFLTDITKKKIYNIQTYPSMALGLILGYAGGAGHGILMSLAGLFTGLALLFIIFLTGGMGAGDVKLLGAIGALKGTVFVLWTMFYTGLIGGMMAFALLIWKGRLLATFKNMVTLLRHPLKAHRMQKPEERIYLPYGVAISLGSVWALCMV